MKKAMTQDEKYKMMTEAPIPGLIRNLAVPTTLPLILPLILTGTLRLLPCPLSAVLRCSQALP